MMIRTENKSMGGRQNQLSRRETAPIWLDDNQNPAQTQPDPGTSTGTSVLEREETAEKTRRSDEGDNDRYAHYVSKERLEQARITGRPVIALCGKVWVPKRNPEDYPVCSECKKVYSQMKGSAGGINPQ